MKIQFSSTYIYNKKKLKGQQLLLWVTGENLRIQLREENSGKKEKERKKGKKRRKENKEKKEKVKKKGNEKEKEKRIKRGKEK